MRGTCFWYDDPLTLCIMQMSLEFSDAELRRLRDHDALLTHVGITTLSDVDCQASMDRMILKFATLSAQEIPKLKSLASFKILTFKDLKAAKMALATKEDAEPVLRLAKLMGLIGDNFSGSTLDVFILASQQAGARDSGQRTRRSTTKIVGRRRNALRRERPLTGRNEHDNKAGWRRRGVRALA